MKEERKATKKGNCKVTKKSNLALHNEPTYSNFDPNPSTLDALSRNNEGEEPTFRIRKHHAHSCGLFGAKKSLKPTSMKIFNGL